MERAESFLVTERTPGPPAVPRPLRGGWALPLPGDPRIPFAAILTLYAVLGCTVLRFNRTPLQILLTVGASCLFDSALCYLLRGARVFPLSAYITGLSLALLLNYAHNNYLLFLPVFLAIGSKYVFTFEGRHVYNPSMFGVAVSLLAGGDLITTAPAYQWGGTWAMSAFIATAALSLFVFRIGRNPLIISFLSFYLVQIALRAYIMRWYLPPEALLLGTLTSAPFFIFVFYMITDPQTSPAAPRQQIGLALALVLVDLYLHTLTSLYTFFYAAFIVATARFLWLHCRRLRSRGWGALFSRAVFRWATWRPLVTVGLAGAALLLAYRHLVRPGIAAGAPAFLLTPVAPADSGISSRRDGALLDRADARVRHVAKWLLSAGAAAAVADFDNDGRIDLLVTAPFSDRPVALYRNLGSFRFEPVEVPAFREIAGDPAARGLLSGGVFADYDNDGDQDLLLTVSYGKIVLLRNRLAETGEAGFEDVTRAAGIDEHAVSIAATFLDFDRDGRLDLFIANALNPYLERYRPPHPLNIFRLPAPEFPGDRRMLPFMHSSWDNAENGGLNALYRNLGNGRFQKMDIRALGMAETHWSLAVASGDLNNDGWPDLYVANDFGPDDLYLNEGGKRFRRVQGRLFGSIGRDTYKGMNVSLGDIDRNGFLDIYVSNVHVPLQAEGSLLWMTYPSRDRFVPRFVDEAWQRSALNEHRFGWGAALGDLDNDGWLDIVQTNGMVDDSLDKRFATCPDYWYVNEKLMRSGPEIHTYADMWGDLRGRCINGKEADRIYLNRGNYSRLQFVDIAERLGWKPRTPSRGALLADFDDDGALDVAITRLYAPLELYRNALYDAKKPSGPAARPRHWIGFLLEGDGVTCNRDAVGSRIVLSYTERGAPARQIREVHAVNAFAAQGERRQHFGLGAGVESVEVSISWCGAPPVSVGPMEANRYHTIVQSR
ncbi:MAG TPA: FG-GAP-like repeat-containing protein [candidate division Zixibacteria bacterium]|nr:FG-GAP-like repeat-containing protein [candidate division Zixibacteria bacterium]